MIDAANEESRKQAARTVERFVRRFDDSYRLLAYHAALPLVLTPELVNYLRNEFLRSERVPWVAEVDLLLSDLCSQVGYELYAMDTHVRAYLLEQMKEHYGKQRMGEVARVLISYVSYLSRLNPGRRQQELEAQRWAAMVYLGDEQCKAAAREIAQRLIETSSGEASERISDAGIRAELARLTRITEELSSQLQEEPILLEYARLMQQILRTPEEVSPSELRRSKVLPEALARALQISAPTVIDIEGFPPSQTFPVEVATIVFEDDEEEQQEKLKKWEFETVFIDKKGEIVQTQSCEAYYYQEPLGEEIEPLKMIAIPEGTFWMGSPEKDRYDRESPQHQVKVAPFFMSQTPITQAQWRFVASLPQEKRKLKANPSRFEGNDNPVEQVSWYDAIEFCARLSRHTGRNYRLPSEAEWEYACRASQKEEITLEEWNEQYNQPFHFGATLTTELANYGRGKTTPMRSFKPNAFGLYDMHGNVWEWCLDPWHENYEGAPTDGRVWDEVIKNDNHYQNISENLEVCLNDKRNRILRGGSWGYFPRYCRSACRLNYSPVIDYDYIGFRVVCSLPRTP